MTLPNKLLSGTVLSYHIFKKIKSLSQKICTVFFICVYTILWYTEITGIQNAAFLSGSGLPDLNERNEIRPAVLGG